MRIAKFLFPVLLALLAFGAQAQGGFQQGRDYVLINPPQPSDAPKGMVEAVEFFSYYCPHCANLDPAVNAWARKLPKDVAFRRVPVVFRPEWAGAAKLYYALEATNQIEKLHAAVFDAVHKEHLPILSDQKILLDWVAKKGGDAKALGEALNSFSVQSRVSRAQQQQGAFKVAGVPAIAVDGRFMNADEFGGDKLSLADFLIAKARADKSGKK